MTQIQNPVIDRKRFLEALEAKRKGRTLTAFAPELGVTYQFLAKVIAGDYHPGPKIAKALGFEQVVMFRKLPRKSPTKPAPKTKTAAAK